MSFPEFCASFWNQDTAKALRAAATGGALSQRMWNDAVRSRKPPKGVANCSGSSLGETRLAKIRDTEKLFVGIMVIQIFEMPWRSLPWISLRLWVKGDENSLSGRTCRTFLQMKMGPGRKPSQKGSSLPSFQRYASIRESKKITTYKNRSSLHSVQTPNCSGHIPYFRGDRFVNAF